MAPPRMKWEWNVGHMLTIALILFGGLGQGIYAVREFTRMQAAIEANATRIAASEARTSSLEGTTDRTAQQVVAQAIQLGRMEEQLIGLRSDMGRIIRLLEGGPRQ